jgi:hypothetical protein
MESDEERPDAEPEMESGRSEPPSEPPASAEGPPQPATQGRPEGSGGFVRTAVISVATVVLGVALFVAGFFTHSLLDDDDDLGSVEQDLAALAGQVGQIQDLLGGAVGNGTSPTPAPTVAATADDDPFIGPEDASVTVIEFTDYQ